jgi:hypothetical protein
MQDEGNLAEAAFASLLEGARSRRTDPDVMHGALAFLDKAAANKALPEEYAVDMDGALKPDYRLVFSTAVSFKPWRYMPVEVCVEIHHSLAKYLKG